MTAEPKRREEVPFQWSATTGMSTYGVLAGVPKDQLFLSAETIAEAYRVGMPRAREAYGPDVSLTGPRWLGISYGHANTLGCDLIFPEDSEMGHEPVHDSLEEGIEALQEDVDFESSGMFPFFLDLWEELQTLFPDENIPFRGFGWEGPITTGWTLRGHGFFTDLMDRPELTAQYISLVIDSIIDYAKTIARINGEPEVSETAMGICDDISAMVPPRMWPDLVLPFLQRYYSRLTTGRRNAHIEDLSVPHLHYLDELGLSFYDPSVSPKLTPALIRDNCRVPFGWRLNSTHYPQRSCSDIQRWVFEAAAGGASRVWTYATWPMCTPEKVGAFIGAARRVEELLEDGCKRTELVEYV